MDELKDLTKELLKKKIFHFETNGESYDYFPEFIRKLLDEYLEVMKNKEFWKEFHTIHYPNNSTAREIETGYESFNNMIAGFCNKINDSIENYYGSTLEFD